MSDDIKPGDVVECIDLSPVPANHLPCTAVRIGAIYRVDTTTQFEGIHCLVLRDVVPCTLSGAYGTYRFRKIDASSDEFAAQIRACRPVDEKAAA